MICLADWRIRASLLTCFIVAPFLKFIAENEYGFLHAEVAAGAVLLLIPCLLLGWLARGKAFYVVAGFCIVMAGTYPLVHLAKPLFRMRLWEGAALLTRLRLEVFETQPKTFGHEVANVSKGGSALDARDLG